MKRDYLWSYYYEFDDQYVWFVPYWHNFLCCYNLHDKKMELMRELPGDSYIAGYYVNIAKVKHRIYILPASAIDILIYDIEEDCFGKIPLVDKKIRIDKFLSYYIWNDNLYVFPGSYPAILKINLHTNKVEYQEKIFEKIGFRYGHLIFQLEYFCSRNKLYFLSTENNQVIVFDLQNESVSTVEVGDKSNIYRTICGDEDGTIYLSNQQGDIVISNGTSSVTIPNTLQNEEKDRVGFKCSINTDKEIYFFSEYLNQIIVLNKDRMCLEEAEWLEKEVCEGKEDELWQGSTFGMFQKTGENIYGSNIKTKQFFVIDVKEKNIVKYIIEASITEKYISEIWKKYTGIKEKVMCEFNVEYLTLNTFLNELNIEQGNTKKTSPEVGKRIFDNLIKDI